MIHANQALRISQQTLKYRYSSDRQRRYQALRRCITERFVLGIPECYIVRPEIQLAKQSRPVFTVTEAKRCNGWCLVCWTLGTYIGLSRVRGRKFEDHEKANCKEGFGPSFVGDVCELQRALPREVGEAYDDELHWRALQPQFSYESPDLGLLG